ncbi:hypothetical protein PCE1_000782 [Barthelona sp. PCE]
METKLLWEGNVSCMFPPNSVLACEFIPETPPNQEVVLTQYGTTQTDRIMTLFEICGHQNDAIDVVKSNYWFETCRFANVPVDTKFSDAEFTAKVICDRLSFKFDSSFAIMSNLDVEMHCCTMVLRSESSNLDLFIASASHSREKVIETMTTVCETVRIEDGAFLGIN